MACGINTLFNFEKVRQFLDGFFYVQMTLILNIDFDSTTF